MEHTTEIRMHALEGLAEDDYPREIVVNAMENALQDPDLEVSAVARYLLSHSERR